MGKIQKVVIDTNVIISAFGWGGRPLQIAGLFERGVVRNCVSEQTLKELTAALAFPKLAFSHATQTSILEFVLVYSDVYEPADRICAAPDPDDDKFIFRVCGRSGCQDHHHGRQTLFNPQATWRHSGPFT